MSIFALKTSHQRNPQPYDPTANLILGWFLFVVGCCFCIFSYFDYKVTNDSNSYEQIEGILHDVTITYRTGHNAVDNTISHFTITYEYHVDGVKYRGDKFSYGNGNIIQYQTMHKVGNSIPVFYDLKNPKRSVLIKGSRTMKYDFLSIMGIIIILCSILLICSRRSRVLRKIANSLFD